MAQRRMFNKVVINSARFLKMPATARLLYFDLGLRADDDGIVEAYTVMKATGSSEDDLKVLAAKEFIKVLNEDLVAYILDWTQHNLIRADRKIDSIYKNLLLQIVPDCNLIEPRPRADTGKQTGRPSADNGQHRLGKDSIGKDSKKKAKTKRKKSAWVNENPPLLNDIKKYAEENNLTNVDIPYFYKFFTTGNWIDSKGNKVLNWKQKLLTWGRMSQDRDVAENKPAPGHIKKFGEGV